eukprot:1749899-Rhodomonas_salina.2
MTSVLKPEGAGDCVAPTNRHVTATAAIEGDAPAARHGHGYVTALRAPGPGPRASSNRRESAEKRLGGLELALT